MLSVVLRFPFHLGPSNLLLQTKDKSLTGPPPTLEFTLFRRVMMSGKCPCPHTSVTRGGGRWWCGQRGLKVSFCVFPSLLLCCYALMESGSNQLKSLDFTARERSQRLVAMIETVFPVCFCCFLVVQHGQMNYHLLNLYS